MEGFGGVPYDLIPDTPSPLYFLLLCLPYLPLKLPPPLSLALGSSDLSSLTLEMDPLLSTTPLSAYFYGT